jgi:PhzF family phenazine biosynthesis protein
MSNALPFFQVDAFTKQPFAGNPAAVVLAPEALDADLMQRIAAENNLPETAFVWPWPSTTPDALHIRWFTPTIEVALCGHATLAAAHALFNLFPAHITALTFHSQRGALPVCKSEQGTLSMRFPEDRFQACAIPANLEQALGVTPLECYRGQDDLLAILANEAAVAQLHVDMDTLSTLQGRGVIVSAKADHAADYDIVSRFFAPQSGIPEDPVTGSAHTTLAPFWCQRLGLTSIRARQLSPRGGALTCHYEPPLVAINGDAITVIEGTIHC